MKRIFLISCVIIVLGLLISGEAYSQSLEEIKAQARAEVRREMGLDDPAPAPTTGKRYVEKTREVAAPGSPRVDMVKQIVGIMMVIAIIPGAIAKIKGRSFIAWWVLGLLCFIVVFPISVYMKKLPKEGEITPAEKEEEEALGEADIYKKIESLSKLKEKGILSEEEFNSKKRELIKRI